MLVRPAAAPPRARPGIPASPIRRTERQPIGLQRRQSQHLVVPPSLRRQFDDLNIVHLDLRRLTPCDLRQYAMTGGDDIFLNKAEESLAGAASEMANRRTQLRQLQLLCLFPRGGFGAIRGGIAPGSDGQWSHSAVQAQFAGVLVNRRKRFSSDLERHIVADDDATTSGGLSPRARERDPGSARDASCSSVRRGHQERGRFFVTTYAESLRADPRIQVATGEFRR